MSTRLLVTAVGTVVGAYFGYPQLGFVIGSALGGYLDPQRITGPRLTDAQHQTAQDGGPIPRAWGRPAPFSGTVIWTDVLVEHKTTKTQGKGGPKVTEYTYTRSYAIGLCVGPIDRITRMWRNEALVYDKTDSAGVAAQAMTDKFTGSLAIYLGDETQLPDPTIEAVLGVGNINANRGLCYFVVTNDDLTDVQGAVPVWKVEVEKTGDSVAPVVTLEALTFNENVKVWKDTCAGQMDPRRSDIPYEYGVREYGEGYAQTRWYATVDAALAFENTRGFPGGVLNAQLRGWSKYVGSDVGSGTGSFDGAEPMSPWDAITEPTNSLVLGLVYSRQPFDHEYNQYNEAATCSPFTVNVWARTLLSAYTGLPLFGSAVWTLGGFTAGLLTGTCDVFGSPQGMVGYYDLIILCRPKLTCTPFIDPSWIELPDAPGYYVDTAGNLHNSTNACAPVAGSYNQLSVMAVTANGNVTYDHLPHGPVLDAADPVGNATYWMAAYATARDAGKVPAGWTYGADYPKATATACACYAPAPPTAGVPLWKIVTDLCLLSSLTAGDLDVSELVEVVKGFLVGSFSGAADATLPLMLGFGFDAGEWDDKLRFPLRGHDSKRTLAIDALVQQSNAAPVKTIIKQDVELPRKLTIQYFDPGTDGTPTTQSAERNTDDVHAVGETTIQLPVVMTATHCARRAAILLKTMWSELEGDQQFSLPYRQSDITVTDCLMVPVDSRLIRMRVDSIDAENGVIVIVAKRDRTSSHESGVLGVSPPPTTPIISGLIGPTNLQILNIPVLRNQDDALGYYIAVAGYLRGWAGAEVQLSTDGGTTFDSIGTMTLPAVIGLAASTLPAAMWEVIDRAHTLSITLGNDTLDSITELQLLNRVNMAVLGDEIIQFETATQTGAHAWDLSTLTRGRFNTPPIAHAAGERFVLLTTALAFVQIDRAYIGRTLVFRAVSLGTAEELAPQQSVVFAPAWTETEWEPTLLEGVRDGSSNLVVTWVGRGRLGVGFTAFNSVSFAGYRIAFTDGITTKTFDTTAQTYSYTAAAQTADFGSAGALTVRVYELNSITGASPTYAEAVL